MINILFLENTSLDGSNRIPEEEQACFRSIHPGLHKSILSNMRKLSFRSTDAFSASRETNRKQSGDSKPSTGEGDEVKDKGFDHDKMLKMMQIGDTQHHFTRNGHLVANKQLIYKINQNKGVKSVRKIAVIVLLRSDHVEKVSV